MQERVFISQGYGRYNEVLRCDMLDGARYFSYADKDWGLYCYRDFVGTSEILLESEVEAYHTRIGVAGEPTLICVDDVNVSLTNSKFGSIDVIAETLVTLEGPDSSFSRSRLYNFLDGFAGLTFLHCSGLKNRGVMHTILNLHNPLQSDCGGISLYRDVKDHKRGRRTTMKAGRAFRHMFRNATDTSISEVTEAYIEYFTPRSFTFHSGYKAADFEAAYEGDTAVCRNPRTTQVRKNLATSCMQGVTRDGYSVGEAYASGDFHIAWLEDDNGRIAGRVVVGYKEDDCEFISGPVYGVCEQSIDTLEAYLGAIKAVDSDDCGWTGLTLSVVGGTESPVVPYLDGDYSGDILNSTTIRILEEGYGDFNFSNTDGYTNDTRACENCEGECHEDQEYTTPDGECLCEDCFHQQYTYTDDGDLIAIEDAVDAMFYTKHGRVLSNVTHVDNAVYIEDLDEYWYTDNVSWCDTREDYYPTHLLESEEEELAA